MLKSIRIVLVAFIGMAVAPLAAAQVVDTNKLFFGAGVSSNETSDSDSAVGWQLFGGYTFGEVTRNVIIDAEVGYMDSGNMHRPGRPDLKANGLWATGVVRIPLTQSIEALGRLGMDFGDDDGVMAGIGVGFLLTRNIKVRFEFVQRDKVDSVQLNMVFYP